MNTKLIGAFGEQTAARYLRDNGYEMVTANYKTKAGELDIVAKKDGITCVVEVKTRKSGGMLPPKDAVDFNKQENIKSATAALINHLKITTPIRYDIIEVLIEENRKVISVNHIENAF